MTFKEKLGFFISNCFHCTNIYNTLQNNYLYLYFLNDNHTTIQHQIVNQSQPQMNATSTSLSYIQCPIYKNQNNEVLQYFNKYVKAITHYW